MTPRTLIACLRFSAAVRGPLAAAVTACAASFAAAQTSDPFTAHWMVNDDYNEARFRGADWEGQFNFGGVPVFRDHLLIYPQFLGLCPTNGIQETQYEGYMEAHLASLTEWIL